MLAPQHLTLPDFDETLWVATMPIDDIIFFHNRSSGYRDFGSVHLVVLGQNGSTLFPSNCHISLLMILCDHLSPPGGTWEETHGGTPKENSLLHLFSLYCKSFSLLFCV